MKTTSEI